MRYFKYKDSETNQIIYNEFDEDYYCVRAVYETERELKTTNFICETSKYILPEGSFADCIEDLGDEITESDFIVKWEQALQPFLSPWQVAKGQLVIGENITATIKCHYPQGTIFEIGEIFYGIADYNECKELIGESRMYPDQQTTMTVQGFDENNMWIVLKPRT